MAIAEEIQYFLNQREDIADVFYLREGFVKRIIIIRCAKYPE